MHEHGSTGSIRISSSRLESNDRKSDRGNKVANYRRERMFIMLDRPIPGFDHLKAVDPVALANVRTRAEADTEGLG